MGRSRGCPRKVWDGQETAESAVRLGGDAGADWAGGAAGAVERPAGKRSWSAPASGDSTAPGFLDTSGGCQGMASVTIVGPGAFMRSGSARDHRYAAGAAVRAAAGGRWPSRSMSPLFR